MFKDSAMLREKYSFFNSGAIRYNTNQKHPLLERVFAFVPYND
jgi:hypothetical protein